MVYLIIVICELFAGNPKTMTQWSCDKNMHCIQVDAVGNPINNKGENK